jgi:hypothetical protein
METSVIIGISGIILGAAPQFFLGKRAEAAKQFKLLQAQAMLTF